MSNFLVQSVAATQFIGALVENEAETAAIPGLRADGTIGVSSITVRSKQNLAWRVEQLDYNGNVIGSHQFATTDGAEKTIDSVTYYYYNYTPPDEWAVPHTVSYQSTWAIRNTSADSKTAGSDGELVLYLKTCVG